jgi:hypothetical protein
MENQTNTNQPKYKFAPNDKCQYCQMEPRAHSFRRMTNVPTQDGQTIFYSKVANALLYDNTESILEHFQGELEGVGEWRWIFDCREMGLKHYTQFGLVKHLARLIEKQGGLRRIYLLEPSWLVNVTLKCAGLFMNLPETLFISNPPDDISIL